MSKYSIYTQGHVHTVKVASIESDPDFDYFHVTQSNTGDLHCDGDSDKCEAGKCAHLRAVIRHINQSKA